MQLYTFKARSLAEALRLIRDELGPDASVLHTREVGSPLARFLGGPMIEVTASAELDAPSRLPEGKSASAGCRAVAQSHSYQGSARASPSGTSLSPICLPPAELHDFRRQIRQSLMATAQTEPSLVEQLAAGSTGSAQHRFSAAVPIAKRLRRAGVSDQTAQRWLDRLEAELACDPDGHADRKLDRLRQIIAAELAERILPVASPSDC